MKKILFSFVFFATLSCSEVVDKPENLIDEDTMAELVAELAINDQLAILNQQGDMEISSKYILNKYKVKGKDVIESHSYYLTKPDKMSKIYDKAQDIILNKDSKIKAKLEAKIKKESDGNTLPDENIPFQKK